MDMMVIIEKANSHHSMKYANQYPKVNFIKTPKGSMFVYDARKPSHPMPLGKIEFELSRYHYVVNGTRIYSANTIEKILQRASELLI